MGVSSSPSAWPWERTTVAGKTLRLVPRIDSLSPSSLCGADAALDHAGAAPAMAGDLRPRRAAGPVATDSRPAGPHGHAVAAVVAGGPKLPPFLPAIGRHRARVAFFVGCVADAMFRPAHWATLRVLQQNGCDVIVPDGPGLLRRDPLSTPAAAGAPADGRRQRGGLRHWRASTPSWSITAAAGRCSRNTACTGTTPGSRGGKLHRHGSGRTRISRELGLVPPEDASRPWPPTTTPATWPTRRRSCGPAATAGADSRPGPARSAGDGICCGSAGTYNLNSRPWPTGCCTARSTTSSHGAEIVLAANAGCLLQIGSRLRHHGHCMLLMHPLELLDLSYRGQPPNGLGGNA